MTHRTNGKHNRATDQPTRRFEIKDSADQPSAGWDSFGESLTQAHEIFIRRSSEFIRKQPGTSLIAAAILGVAIGWIVKRRS